MKSSILQFSANVASNHLMLFEFDESLIAELTAGQEFVLRGQPNDDSVLCTRDKTFLVRQAETSNTCMLLDCLVTKVCENNEAAIKSDSGSTEAKEQDADSVTQTPCIIQGLVTHHFELIPSPPKLLRINELLEPCAITASEDRALQSHLRSVKASSNTVTNDEDDDDSTLIHRTKRPKTTADIDVEMASDATIIDQMDHSQGFTKSALLNIVQASEQELMEGLKQAHAVEIHGRWRLIEKQLIESVVDAMVTIVVAKGWDHNTIPLNLLVAELVADGIASPFLSRHCATTFSRESSRKGETTGLELISWDTQLLATFRAIQLLRPRESMLLDDFTVEWKLSLPSSMSPSIASLKSNTLITQVTATTLDDTQPKLVETIKYFPTHLLSLNPVERFDQLFAMRKRWRQEDISDYVKVLTSSSMSMDQLLLKYTRPISEVIEGKNVTMYAKR